VGGSDSNNAVRRIAHLDMDAFYASVELLRYPHLRDLPVVIGGSRAGEPRELRHYAGRGVVTTATYPARAFGVHSAMGLMKAAQLCPQAVLLPADFEQYRKYSRLFKQVIAHYAPDIEDRGIDEVYIDFTTVHGGQVRGGRALAQTLQQAIRDETGLTCSIGVAPNKLLAKMASEFDKPNGITVLHESDLASKIWPLPCRKVNGIGPRMNERLEALGIRTVGELARCKRDWLAGHFGPNHGAWLHSAAWGWDDRPVVTHSEPVSMSRETTFERDLHAVRDRSTLGAIFTRLCEQVAADLQRHRYVGRTIGIKLRFDDFQRITRDCTIAEATNDAAAIRRTAGLCLKRAPLERRLRLLGVRVAGLQRTDAAAAAVAASAHGPSDLSLF
jgi:DNA polymerase IV